MLAEAVQGLRRLAAGVTGNLTLGPYSALYVQSTHGQYTAACLAGRLYHTVAKTVTVAATHNSPISAATATPVAGIGNPVGSGKAAVLLRAGFSTTSGTPAGGQVVINTVSNAMGSMTAAATGTIGCGLVRGDANPQGSVMRPLNNVALAGLPTTGTATIISEVWLMGGAAAAAATGGNGPVSSGEDIGGAIIIPPGAVCAIMAGTGAGTTWIVNASLSWEEIDWPL